MFDFLKKKTDVRKALEKTSVTELRKQKKRLENRIEDLGMEIEERTRQKRDILAKGQMRKDPRTRESLMVDLTSLDSELDELDSRRFDLVQQKLILNRFIDYKQKSANQKNANIIEMLIGMNTDNAHEVIDQIEDLLGDEIETSDLIREDLQQLTRTMDRSHGRRKKMQLAGNRKYIEFWEDGDRESETGEDVDVAARVDDFLSAESETA
ncbi:hypothetical protein JW777_10020 [bacterium]|nr:hypothetical protein [bacterium]